jgi:hypothetical protein
MKRVIRLFLVVLCVIIIGCGDTEEEDELKMEEDVSSKAVEINTEDESKGTMETKEGTEEKFEFTVESVNKLFSSITDNVEIVVSNTKADGRISEVEIRVSMSGDDKMFMYEDKDDMQFVVYSKDGEAYIYRSSMVDGEWEEEYGKVVKSEDKVETEVESAIYEVLGYPDEKDFMEYAGMSGTIEELTCYEILSSDDWSAVVRAGDGVNENTEYEIVVNRKSRKLSEIGYADEEGNRIRLVVWGINEIEVPDNVLNSKTTYTTEEAARKCLEIMLIAALEGIR